MKSYDFITRQLELEYQMIKAWSRGPLDIDERITNEDGSLAVFEYHNPELHQNLLQHLREKQHAQRLVSKHRTVMQKRRKSGRFTLWRAVAPELVYSTTEQIVNQSQLELLEY